ncbi:MAG: polysaccharide deacetylase family protein [Pseudolysinimonas sp.]|uniref:polysaccharide deacetylase family protein n=1 Tax=Pseudolysinimonas sp. TaxID=2680009 RepID=UPI00326317E7
MKRRTLIAGIAALSAGAAAGAVGGGFAYAETPKAPALPRAVDHARVVPHVKGAPTLMPAYFPIPHLTKIPIPGGMIHGLPGEGNLIAFTVDDGVSSDVVGAYAEFARTTGMRITFFVTASYPAWRDHADALRPMVESGQIQLANHTWNHPDFTKISDGEIRSQLERCGDFIRTTFGVEAAPYFRPPYGNADARVLAAARAAGYPQAVHWYGSIGDSGPISDENMSMLIDRWVTAQRIVIGHANQPTILGHFDELVKTIRDRGLQPVTFDDVFLRP